MNVSLCCVTLEDSYQKKSHNNILEYPSKFYVWDKSLMKAYTAWGARLYFLLPPEVIGSFKSNDQFVVF